METSILELHPGLVWGFAIVIVIMLLLDLGVFNKKSHEVSSKEATIWSVVWISLSMAFSLIVYWVFDSDAGGHDIAIEKLTQYQAAYWIEKALSVDNLFVFILVFGYFKVPRYLHHTVLFWGIIGALVFRAIFIFLGVGIINITYLEDLVKSDLSIIPYTLISLFFLLIVGVGVYFYKTSKLMAIILVTLGISLLTSVNVANILDINSIAFPKVNIVLTLFGGFLIYAGISSWGSGDDEGDEDFNSSAGATLVKKLYKVSDNYEGSKFFTVKNGVKMATPLLVVVAVIEFTDVLFAVDSIPAIFAISNDPFILYTSNIFAILGLRSLYFLLSNFIHMFNKLPYGLSIILTFIGIKMLIAPWFHISSPISLGIVAGVLVLSVVASILFIEKKPDENIVV